MFSFLWYQGNNSATQQEMADYVSEKMEQKVSRYSVSRMLKKLHFTRKRLTNRYSEQLSNTYKVNEFKELIASLPKSQVFALDEASFHLNEAPRYGYSHKSFRAIIRKPGSRGNNHTLILCIRSEANQGVIY